MITDPTDLEFLGLVRRYGVRAMKPWVTDPHEHFYLGDEVARRRPGYKPPLVDWHDRPTLPFEDDPPVTVPAPETSTPEPLLKPFHRALLTEMFRTMPTDSDRRFLASMRIRWS